MKSYKKIISLILVMIIIFGEACLCLSKKSFAESSQLGNVEFKENESDIRKIQDKRYERYSEEYKKYLELSDEEKAKVEVIPRKYDIPFETLYENDSTFGLYADAENLESIPASFDLRDVIDIPVKNQGSYGNCWNFSSIKALETYLLLNNYGDYDFSELHLDYITSEKFGGNRNLHDGGNFNTFYEYVAKGQGPVLESEAPYSETYEIKDYDYLLSLKPKAYVGDVIEFPTIDKAESYTDEEMALYRNKVKQHIMKNGGLYTSIASPADTFTYKAICYNNDTNSEYFPAGETLLTDNMHAVTIIGWDDNYSKDNFNENLKPQNDGAYIAINSWGENWGDNGVFYISYEDYYVERDLSGIVSAGTTPIIQEITFKDQNLYNYFKENLKEYVFSFKDDELKLNVSNLALNMIDELNLSNKNISDITGLEYFTNLMYLHLDNNTITDITSLQGMTKLEELYLNNNNITDITPLEGMTKLYELYLDNNNISNLSSLSNMDELYRLNLANNNVTTVAELSKIKSEYITLDLSGNKNLNLSELSNLQNLDTLVLNDCDLVDSDLEEIKKITTLGDLSVENNNITDISTLTDSNISYISLSGNKNIDLTTIPNIFSDIKLANCNLTNADIEELEYINFISIDLSNNPISDIGVLKNKVFYNLNIGNTNVKDVSGLPYLRLLYASGNTNMTGIDTLSNLVTLEMKDANLTDISWISSLTNLTDLDLSNNNIIDCTPLEQLSNLSNLNLSHNSITDCPNMANFKNLCNLNLSNNNIEEANIREKVIELDISNNKLIKSNLNLSVTNKRNAKNQIINRNIEIEKNKDNKFDLPEPIMYAYENRYKEKSSVVTENCSIDYENKRIIINTDDNTEKTAKIQINGGIYDGSIYTITYTGVDSVALSGIRVGKAKARVFIEGDSVAKSDLFVEKIYVNGAVEETTDYSIVNGENLLKNQENITVQYDNYSEEFGIQVVEKEQAVKVKLNDRNLYLGLLDVLKWNDLQDDILYQDDENNYIELKKDTVGEIIEIDATNVKDLTGISALYNLENIYLDEYTDVSDISELTQLPKLEYITITDGIVDNIGDLLNTNNISFMDIKSKINLTDTEDKVIALPQIIQELYKKGNCTIEYYYNVPEDGDLSKAGNLGEVAWADKDWYYSDEYDGIYSMDDTDFGVIMIEGENEITVELDKEITDLRHAGRRAIKFISNADFSSGTEIVMYYNVSEKKSDVPDIKAGDIDGDGVLTISDLLKMKFFIVGLSMPSEAQKNVADLNGNGMIEISDLLKLKLMLVD